MFCCAVCNVMYTGVYPETVSATPCGHVFHTNCIMLCLNKFSKCPFCTVYVRKSQLIKLHFQIDSNWKATVDSLKAKANSSIFNLDETLNESLIIKNLDPNSSVKNDNSTIINLDETFNNSLLMIEDPGTKTLITTSLSGFILPPQIQSLQSVFNDILPNSVVKNRLLVSEINLLQMAAEEGFTNILIINLSHGYPIGLSLVDLLSNLKTNVMLSSFNCFDYDKIVIKKKAPPLKKINTENLNNNQEFIVNFFTKICNSLAEKQINEEEIIIKCCKYSQRIQFTYNLAGLNFHMIHPSV